MRRRFAIVGLVLAAVAVAQGQEPIGNLRATNTPVGSSVGLDVIVRDPAGDHATIGRRGTDIRCTVEVSTATTIQAVGGSCAAPGAGLSIYVTDIQFSSNAQGIAADAFPTLKYGTGGTCGTGTAIFWLAMLPAATQTHAVAHFVTPIKIPANNEICWINSTAGSKALVITGYIAS